MRYLVLIALWGILSAPAFGQSAGAVVGSVVDADTDEPIGFAQVLLEEANRSATADEAGQFEILFVHGDTYTLKAFRIGYQPLTQSVRVPAGDTLRVTLQMASTLIEQGEIVVEGAREDVRQFADADMELEGRKLRQNLGTTIAETLDEEPGISMRSMGPAPARPVLRGLGGERLLVLEDGGRTGDLSATSTDHAVVIDPLTSERIEVIRGPAALVYGPNTLGGVVNVIRGVVPTSMPRKLTVGASLQGQSVNNGLSSGFGAEAPLGPLAAHVDASVRTADDVSTPVGPLENTELTTLNGSAGLGLIGNWGHAGLAGSYYRSSYGIPGGFVGAHPDGVNIELDRRRIEARAEIFDPIAWIPRMELEGSFSRYEHQEYEADDVLGIEFGLLSYHGRALFHTHRNGHMRKGAFGLWSEYRDYASGGYSHTPASTEWTLAGFGFQDVHFEGFTLQVGLRYDYRRVRPGEEQESETIGTIRERSFGGVSASLRGMIHPREDLSAGVTLMRSLRMPGIEELYSEGPHLAAYSFEIGNPELGLERGWGAEVFGRYEHPTLTASVATYYNLIDGYIFPLNTGETNVQTLLPIYQQTGAEARMLGAEASIGARILDGFHAAATASFVHGTLTNRDEPLPWMPPLSGKLDASYERNRLTLGATTRFAAEQKRTGPFEEPTNGYLIFGAYAQYYFETGPTLHTIDLIVENIADAEYRDHLSRVKSVMPEPGRNIKLLYRIYL